ncbi:Uncharacterized protein dnm_065800 [Desulfonema magnum]|uniref:Uncharacterized protein n=1 Tax=Desulfonema magnum TaxID=45655 RepID=A0A975BSR5_9BACT|nr:Uncharacterized protein dnm_065800 [Desulfonema magnum]
MNCDRMQKTASLYFCTPEKNIQAFSVFQFLVHSWKLP